jgi:hypothetical protein
MAIDGASSVRPHKSVPPDTMRCSTRVVIMLKKVFWAGFLGALAMIVFSFLVNGVFGLNSRLNMKPLPAEREVYEVLKKQATQPGHYICNPSLTAEGRFPDHEPVFTIVNSGFTHGAAGAYLLRDLGIALLTALIATGMLAMASPRVLASYARKTLFFALIGLLFGLLTGMRGDYSPADALLKATYEIMFWTVTGLVVAWRLRLSPTPPAEQF